MPIKTGAWRRDLAGLQQRRLKAARMFAFGATQAEVARTFGVSRQAASVWYRQWHHGGEPALRGAGRAGRRPRLSGAELDAVDQALRLGPQAFGFDTQLWTLRRVAAVIEQLTGVGFHPGHVWRLLRRMDWSVQQPARRAIERDEAEIARWRAEEWPRIKGAAERDAWVCFLDESGVSLRPPVRRTWAPRGQTPIVRHHGHWKRASMAGICCYAPGGSRARLCFHAQPGSYNDHTLIEVLKQLRRFLRGSPATLVWDNLPSHHSRVMRDWLDTQRHWLQVEFLPAYAHDLDPVEGLWANLKAVELANLSRDTITEVLDAARQGVARIRRQPALLFSFLQHCDLRL